MARARALLVAISLGALVFGPAGAATQVREGKIRVTATIQYSANVPVGSTVTGSAGVSFADFPKGATGGSQGVSFSSDIVRAGSAATITIEVPYAISTESGRFEKAGLDVSFTARGPTTSASTTQTIAVPPSGATTPVAFTLAL